MWVAGRHLHGPGPPASAPSARHRRVLTSDDLLNWQHHPSSSLSCSRSRRLPCVTGAVTRCTFMMTGFREDVHTSVCAHRTANVSAALPSQQHNTGLAFGAASCMTPVLAQTLVTFALLPRFWHASGLTPNESHAGESRGDCTVTFHQAAFTFTAAD